MKNIIMIAMATINDGIGKKGQLLGKYPKDMRHFQKHTTGHTVVMGRKTWESLPKKPLAERNNIVITNDRTFKAEGATVYHSVEDVLQATKHIEKVFIIGGGEIYKQFMPYADTLIMTLLHKTDNEADTYFPVIDLREWKPDISTMERHEKDKKHDTSFAFMTYHREKVFKTDVKK
ncbi:MAG: dihydrofolate reductase [Gammaproteobacteria bacterium]